MDGNFCFHNERKHWSATALASDGTEGRGEALGFLSVCFYHPCQFVLLNRVSTLHLWSVSRTPPAKAPHDASRGRQGRPLMLARQREEDA